MSTAAARDNSGKPMLSFILQFPTAVAAFARVKELGAIKYERDNWKKGGKPDWEYLDAALRHISAFMEGETFAEDTGCTHLAHAMWNIAAIQDLNYPGVVYDKEIFDAMAEYWSTRRAAEANGETFDVTPEEFLETARKDKLTEWATSSLVKLNKEQETDALGNEVDLEIGPDEEWREEARRRIDSAILGQVFNHIRNKEKTVIGPTEGKDPQEILNEIMGSEPSTFEKLAMPQLFEGTVEFAQPITCRSGDRVALDLEAGTVQVFDSEDNEIQSTTIIAAPKPLYDFDVLKGSAGQWLEGPHEALEEATTEVTIGDPEVCNLGSVDLGNFLDPGIEDAAEELSRVGGMALGSARDAIHQAVNAFTLFADTNPLEDMMAGTVTTTLDEEPGPGELVGKTDRPVSELREEARRNIERHTRQNREANQFQELIGHPSHLRYIKQKQDEAFRRGYEEALAKVRANLEMETGDCGEDCDCGS